MHVAGSGRTDAGVHARAQVAAFTLENPIPADNLQRAVNRLLPPAIRVLDAVETHAGFSSPLRCRRQNLPVHDASRADLFSVRVALRAPPPLSAERDRDDRSGAAFRRRARFHGFAASDDRDDERKIQSPDDFQFHSGALGDHLIYTVRGSGFLKHMVRKSWER